MFILFLNRSSMIMITVSSSPQVSPHHSCSEQWEDTSLPDMCFWFLFPRTKESAGLDFHSPFPLALVWGARKHTTRIDPLITVWTPGQDGYPLNMRLETSDSNKQPELHVNWNLVHFDLLVFTKHRPTCSQDIWSMQSKTHPSPGLCLSLRRGHLKRHRQNQRRCHAAGQPAEAEV